MIKRYLHISSRMRKKTTSSAMWLKRQHKDPYVQKRHEDEYRARSAYKLLEMDEKYGGKLLLGPGATVMECGAAPGAWTQVAAQTVNAGGHYNKKGPQGIVVGCDLLYIEPLSGVILFPRSDFTLPETQQKILDVVSTKLYGNALKKPKFDVVLSDMAPNCSGQSQYDQDRILLLGYTALRFALLHSLKGGNFVTKVWGGPQVEDFIQDLRKYYKDVEKVKPQASRKESSESFLVARDFMGIKEKKLDLS